MQKKLEQSEKDALIKARLNTWGELDFLQKRLAAAFSDNEYSAEFEKLSDLSIEYDMIRNQNNELTEQNEKMAVAMQTVSDADSEIVNTVIKLTTENTNELHKKIKTINSTLAALGLSEQTLIKRANKFSNQLIGSAFTALEFDKKLDPKYQKLADDLELWSGLSRLNNILPLGAPVKNSRITSPFGVREDPFTGEHKKHRGIDFSGKIGDELYAIAPGRVISAGDRFGYGNTVEIDHGLGFSTLYGHLSAINVKRGDWVASGDLVGLAGSSGRSTGPHLHYEIRYKSAQFDPTSFVKE